MPNILLVVRAVHYTVYSAQCAVHYTVYCIAHSVRRMPCITLFSGGSYVDKFQQLCRQGNIKKAKKISDKMSREHIRADNNYAFRLAFSNEDFDMIKWLAQYLTVEDIRRDDNYFFQAACKNGFFEIAIWLVNQFGLSADDVRANDNRAFKYACENGHLKLAKWVAEVGSISPQDISVYAQRKVLENGHFSVYKWLSG